jgi:hypothetical protein
MQTDKREFGATPARLQANPPRSLAAERNDVFTTWIRPGAATALAGIVMIAVAIPMVTMSDE